MRSRYITGKGAYKNEHTGIYPIFSFNLWRSINCWRGSSCYFKWIAPAFRLNKRVEILEDHDKRDFETLKRIAERDSLILEVMSTMLDSQISSDNVEELKKTKQKLTNYLAQNQR